MRKASPIILDENIRGHLTKFSRSRSVSVRLAQRSRIILLASEGLENQEIASKVGITRQLVGRWRNRFNKLGLPGIAKDASRPGRIPRIDHKMEQSIIEATLHTKPTAATHWSVRTMAAAQGISPASVQRIWAKHNLKPHLVQSFKLSNDPYFVEKLQDIVGLYMNPPDKALVLCVDEKSQIQALDRTRPVIPLCSRVPERQTHDYKRNGTTTLFAALSMLDGKVIGDCMARHRHQEFIKFLRLIDKQTPPDLDLHLIVDNYATHKKEEVKRWLKRHPRFHLHFTPTSSSWLNLIERWFRELTDKRIRRGTFNNVRSLIKAIKQFIDNHNQDPVPFVWKAPAERILKKITKCHKALETLH
ncbi:MAG: IS630 family transposase [Candidatus Babeliaceae bacterium]|nr:IS630 family transposase [Candidatus Babeliaceae bacterium]